MYPEQIRDSLDFSYRERRIFDRLPAQFSIHTQCLPEDVPVNAFLVDVSAQGARLLSSQEIFLGQKLVLWMNLPEDSSRVLFVGQIVWVRHRDAQEWEAGVSFDQPMFMKIRRILSYCRNRRF